MGGVCHCESNNKKRRGDKGDGDVNVNMVEIQEGIKIEYTDGNEYTGGMVLGKRSGYGMMRYVDGSVYKGEWVDDLYEGYGSM